MYTRSKPGITSSIFVMYTRSKPGITSSMYVIIQSRSDGLSHCTVSHLIQACRMNTFSAQSQPTQPVCFVVALFCLYAIAIGSKRGVSPVYASPFLR